MPIQLNHSTSSSVYVSIYGSSYCTVPILFSIRRGLQKPMASCASLSRQSKKYCLPRAAADCHGRPRTYAVPTLHICMPAAQRDRDRDRDRDTGPVSCQVVPCRAIVLSGPVMSCHVLSCQCPSLAPHGTAWHGMRVIVIQYSRATKY